ncbi:MAG: hypothetical protein TREMPRED_000010 [Tremellales sp. Tagirdzhanova-0007]|nr:MAG: hypothetical protein TREMPRED_000010 [Tremellales sp. Tagirdzhanova-0007]
MAAQQRYTPVPGMGLSSPHAMGQVSRAGYGGLDFQDEDLAGTNRFTYSSYSNPVPSPPASPLPPSIPYRTFDLSLEGRPPLLGYDSQKHFADNDARSQSLKQRSNGHFWTYWSLRKRLLVTGICVGGITVLIIIIGMTDAQPPWCGATQANVTRDIQILSQLTTRLRLYGADCNETALVLQAIQDTKVNMTIWPAIYVDSNETAYNVQLAAVQNALRTYGTEQIEGIIVGNEYILDTAGSSSITSSAYAAAVSDIVTKVSSVKSTIQGMNLNKNLPIGTSDAGSILSQSLAIGIDFFMANVHPYFGALPIQQAAAWTYEFFQEFDVEIAATASNKPQTYIAETGWPTGSLNSSDASDGAGSPQAFLDTFICQANANGTQYFYFEAFDEPWKAEYGGVEPFWGMFDSDRNLKQITRQAYEQFQNTPPQAQHQGAFSHELIAGAASFAAMREYEKHEERNGKPENYEFAKELIAGIAGAEVDKLIESKGLNEVDALRAKHEAKQNAAHALAQSQQYGNIQHSREAYGGGGGGGYGQQGGYEQGGYGQQGGYDQGGYGQQGNFGGGQGGYGPLGGGYGGPPGGGYGGPPVGGYGGPGGGYPGQGQPQMGGYGAPPGGQYVGTPSGGYGGPPGGGYGGPAGPGYGGPPGPGGGYSNQGGYGGPGGGFTGQGEGHHHHHHERREY